MTKEGQMAENRQKPVPPETTGHRRGDQATGEGKREEAIKQLEEELRKKEEERFKQAQQDLEEALQSSPELQELAKHLQIDVTPEGLRIQIIDQEGEPMFAIGSADMFDKTRSLMQTVADVVKSMPNDVSVRGHTDSFQYAPGATYTNWELSADRANSARRVLLDKGVAATRLNDVMGKADREHLFPENPLDARNRRISIILLRESVEKAFARGAFEDSPAAQALEEWDDPEGTSLEDYEDLPIIDDEPVGTFQRTPGEVFFP